MTALITSKDTREAIKVAGITEATAYKYLRDDDFKSELREYRRDVLFQATSKLTQATDKAVQTLVDVMDDEEATATAKVQSAKTVLDLAYNAVQADDLIERIERIEATQNRKQV